MEVQRLRQLETLFQAALDQEPARRAAFIGAACGGDDVLRREVESLLAHHHTAGDLLDGPAGANLGPLFDAAFQFATGSLAGQTVGGCKVLRQLGAGGMGEVWLAEDAGLGRRVALKLLPVRNAANQWLANRLAQEARAASALNHPNILTVHEVGESEKRPYIISEYVEGVSLRQRLGASSTQSGKLGVAEATEIACQITCGLIAAHAAGLVHRDIKPENVMLRPDGLVKILDFGIAKWMKPVAETTIFATLPGSVMGTAAYMSPEQARGGEVDARSDLWSLGVVLYEMVVGTRPPDGPAGEEIKPTRLRQILGKLLKRDPGERYVSAAALLVDLKALQKDLAAGPNAGLRNLFLALLLLIAAGVAGWAWWAASRPGDQGAFQHVMRLTNVGNVQTAAISPDGRFAAYTVADSGQQGMWVKDLRSNSDSVKFSLARIVYSGLTFSPDSTQIYYLVRKAPDTVNVLYKIPLVGGTPRKVLEDVDSAVTFSPDRKQFSFIRRSSEKGDALMVANVGDDQVSTLVSRKAPNSFAAAAPVWSRDGHWIVFAVDESDARGIPNIRVIAVDPHSGTTRLIVSHGWRSLDGLCWTNGTPDLVAVAWENDANFSQLFQLNFRSGKVGQLTHDLNTYRGISAAADGLGLVTVQTDRHAAVWISSSDHLENAKRITAEGSHYHGLDWISDGQLISFNADGRPALSAVSVDRGSAQPLTEGGQLDWSPQATGDGRVIVSSRRSGSWNIWRLDRDGSHARQLTTGVGPDSYPSYTPDGKWVIYASGARKRTLWKVPLEGGSPVQLTRNFSDSPSISPDGKLIACEYNDDKPGSKPVVAVLPAAGGNPLLTFPNIGIDAKVRWMPDGHGLTFVHTADGISNIWVQPLQGGPPRQITKFNQGRIFASAWRKDGRYLATLRGESMRDVVFLSRN
ncbi:MAG: protein kinase [Acidobacteriota bacterium]|nr:protein kinase [Acidobacteriota bacterium]